MKKIFCQLFNLHNWKVYVGGFGGNEPFDRRICQRCNRYEFKFASLGYWQHK